MFADSAPDFASGWAGDALFLPELSQQVLSAQHLGLHALWVVAFETLHDCAESGIAAIGSVMAIKIDVANLLNTACTS